jgi:hypothetical protein
MNVWIYSGIALISYGVYVYWYAKRILPTDTSKYDDL